MTAVSTAFPPSQIASGTAIEVKYENFNPGNAAGLPIKLFILGMGNSGETFSTEKVQVNSDIDVAKVIGYGSPGHLASIEIFKAEGPKGVPVYLLPVVSGTTPATGNIAPTGTVTAAGTFQVVVNGVKSEAFQIAATATIADICAAITASVTGATKRMSVSATDNTTDVDLTAKAGGTYGNDISISVEGPEIGITWGVTQPSGGAGNPSLSDAFNKLGKKDWVPFGINTLGMDDDVLAEIDTAGEVRWSPVSKNPFVCFSGLAPATTAEAISVTNTRANDRNNSQLVAVGSESHPITIAAAQALKLINKANSDPGEGSQGEVARDVEPGTDEVQWDNDQLNTVLAGGSSTSLKEGGDVTIGDVVTMYHPDDAPQREYAYVNDLVKLWNVMYNVRLIFESASWRGKIMVPDNQRTRKRGIRKPKQARTTLSNLADSLGELGLISDPEFTKQSLEADIDTVNPKRLNVVYPVKLSGNTNVISVDLLFGFYVGGEE